MATDVAEEATPRTITAEPTPDPAVVVAAAPERESLRELEIETAAGPDNCLTVVGVGVDAFVESMLECGEGEGPGSDRATGMVCTTACT